METSPQGCPQPATQWVKSSDRSRLEKQMKIREHHGIMIDRKVVDLFDGMVPSPDVPCPMADAAMEDYDRLDNDGSSANVPSFDIGAPSAQKTNSALIEGLAPQGQSIIATTDISKIETNAAENIATSVSAEKTDKLVKNQHDDDIAMAGCSVARHQPLSQTSIQAPSGSQQKPRRPSRQYKPIQGKSAWQRSTLDEKFAASVGAAQARPFAKAFTLNFSPRCEQTLRDHRDPTRLLSSYLGREMRQFLGRVLPHSFCLEVSPDGRLHLHGVIVLDGKENEHLKLVKRSLARAGGNVLGRKGSRQVSLSEINDASGWAEYALKKIKSTRKILATEKAIFLSKGLRVITRDIACQTHDEFSGVPAKVARRLH